MQINMILVLSAQIVSRQVKSVKKLRKKEKLSK